MPFSAHWASAISGGTSWPASRLAFIAVQLAPGTQTYLEILWGGSWLEGAPGGATFYVRTLPPELDQAYLRMLTDKGPPRAI